MAGKGKVGRRKAADVPLTVPEVRFARALADGSTQRQAYIKSGIPLPEHTSDEYIDKLACNLSKNSKVIALVSDFVEDAVAAARTSIERLAKLSAYCAEVDLTEVFDDDWNVRPKKDWPKELRRGIDVIAVDRDRKTKNITKTQVKASRQAALDRLAKWLGMIGDRPITATETAKNTVIRGADPEKLR